MRRQALQSARLAGFAALGALLIASPIAFADVVPQRPARANIVLILADDLGVMDVCSYTKTFSRTPEDDCFYETPNIDALAAQGAMFERAYAPPLCMPSRASLLTGRFAPEFGMNNAYGYRRFNSSYAKKGLEPAPGSLPHDTIFYTETGLSRPLIDGGSSSVLVRAEGIIAIPAFLGQHDSAFIGKWHLGGGGLEGFMPRDHGFKELAVLDDGFSFYFDWARQWNSAGSPRGGYLTDSTGAQAISWLRRRRSDPTPFFLFVSHFAVHTPLQAPARDVQYFENKSSRGNHGHSNATYAAMLRALDRNVGDIVRELKAQGIYENTLLIFASDNGAQEIGNRGGLITSNAPFIGEKSELYEGGIRVPLVMSWPARARAETRVSDAVDITDLLPTMLEAGGYDPKPYLEWGDGQSLLSVPGVDRHRMRDAYSKRLYFYDPRYRAGFDPDEPLRKTPKAAVIDDEWKLVFYQHGYLQLFNLAQDPFESLNVASDNRAKTAELYKDLRSWLDAIPERYRARPNPKYDPAKDSRYPEFIDDPLQRWADSTQMPGLLPRQVTP